jgi:serine protease Do
MNRKWLAVLAGAVIAIGVGVAALRAQRSAIARRGGAAILNLSGEGAWLGVELKEVTTDDVKNMKLPGEYGARVTEVEDDSPASKAGLKAGDVIIAFEGERVRSAAELRRMVRETPSGRKVSLEISRDGAKQSVEVTFESREAEAAPFFNMEMPRVEVPHMEMPMARPNFEFNMLFGGKPRLGISVDDLTPQLATYFGVSEGKGVLVREVMAGTPAEKAGFKAGDCIVKVGDKAVGSVEELHGALDKVGEKTEQISVTVVRDHNEQTLNVHFEKPETMSGPVAENGESEEWNPMQLQERLKESRELQRNLTERMQERSKEYRELQKNWTDESRKWQEELRRSIQSQGKEFEKLRQELLRLQREPSEV